MCGRYTLATPQDDLLEAFDVPVPAFAYGPRYNVAPGQSAPVVAEDRRGRRLGLLVWGFVPAWRDDRQGGFINARAESVATKTSFREAFARRRCLVPADGFYEWRDGVPHWIYPRDRGVISFAGIWERWGGPGADPLHSFAILTSEASDDVRDVHDRMPVVIAAADRAAWLSRGTDTAALASLLRPSPAGTLDRHVVSTRVNRPEEDDAALIERAVG